MIAHCTVTDCDRKYQAKGYCKFHYYKLLYPLKRPYYQTWCDMKDRCYNINNPRYNRYGGRGIKVCQRWLNSYDNFYQDMGDKPDNSYSIERTDNDKGYSPDNCKWGTKREQSINRDVPPNNSGTRGVGYSKGSNKWRARITISRKDIYLGEFKSIEDAIKCRKKAELLYWQK